MSAGRSRSIRKKTGTPPIVDVRRWTKEIISGGPEW
jgi:hypothetical protein